MNTFFAPLLAAFRGISPRIWLLASVNFVNRCGGMVLCFLTLYLTQKLHYTLINAGYAMACFGAGAIVGQYLGGLLTDRFGYHRIQFFTLAGTGAALLVVMRIHEFWWMCGALFLLNTVSEAFRPANMIAVRMNSTEDTVTRSLSMLRVAFNLAITIALVLGGWLITRDWRYIFWADAGTCFAAALTLWFLLPDVHAVSRSQAREKRAAAKQTLSPYLDTGFLVFTFATFLGALVFMQIIWTLPAFFKDAYRWNEFEIGIVSAVNGAVVMLSEMSVVFAIEKRRSALTWVRLGVIVYAVSYAVFLLPTEWMWFSALFYMVVISFGEIFVMPFSTTWVMRRAPESVQGKYLALYGMSYALANIAAPLLGTQTISRFGYHALWWVLMALCVISFACFSWVARKETIQQRKQAQKGSI